MSIEAMETDVEIIGNLDTRPNAVGGLTADELKEKFDEAAVAIKGYINEVLVPAINEGQEKAEYQERTTAEHEQRLLEHNNAIQELEAVAVPKFTVADTGKVLSVAADGSLYWGIISPNGTVVASEPVLAAGASWYKGSTKRSAITEIAIVDAYTPTGEEAESWDASEAQDGSVTAYITDTVLTLAGNGYGCVYANEDSTQAFFGVKEDMFTALTDFTGAGLLNMSRVATASAMFAMLSISRLDSSTWDMSKVTDLSGAFQGCSSLVDLDTSGWDLNSVTTMQSAFYGCSVLSALDTRKWGLRLCTTLYSTFSGCSSLTALDTSGWSLGKVTSMQAAFSGCSSLTALDTSGWSLGKVTSMQAAFSGCSSLTALDTSGWSLGKVTSMQAAFRGCSSLIELDTGGWDLGSVTTMQGAFYGCSALTSLGDTSKWGLGKCTSMYYTFQGCSELSALDVSEWEMGNVTTIQGVFQLCRKLKVLDPHAWDTSSLQNASFAFYNCDGLSTLNVSGWDVSKVVNFDHMCAHGTFVIEGVENWKPTSYCENMNAMFHSCYNTTIDVSGFETSGVKFFSQMFEYMQKLTKIVGLQNFDTTAGLGFEEMFHYDLALEELDLSSFDTGSATDGVQGSTNGHLTATLWNMLYRLDQLKKITLGEFFRFDGDGTTTNEGNHAVLPTPNAEYIPGATGLWYSEAHPEGQTPSEVAATHSGTVTYYAVKEEMP